MSKVFLQKCGFKSKIIFAEVKKTAQQHKYAHVQLQTRSQVLC